MELLHWGPLAQVITKGGTTVNQEIMPAYAAYQKAIDLTLYHAFAELVIQTSQDDKARMHYRQIEAPRFGSKMWMSLSILSSIACAILERCWSGLRKSWAQISVLSVHWHWTCRYTHTPRRPDVCGQSA